MLIKEPPARALDRQHGHVVVIEISPAGDIDKHRQGVLAAKKCGNCSGDDLLLPTRLRPEVSSQGESGTELPSIWMTWFRISCAVTLVKCFCEDMVYRTAVTAKTTRPNTLK